MQVVRAKRKIVCAFADEQGIAPGIVVGRLQHEGHLPWRELNGLKVRLQWKEVANIKINALPEWHPAIADSHIEGGESSDSVGCIRNFNLHDGGNIREQLLTLSDVTFTCTYSILESPMSVEDYVATLSLTPITDGNRTYIQWTAEFGCPADEEDELVDFVGNGVFQGGFDSLKRILKK